MSAAAWISICTSSRPGARGANGSIRIESRSPGSVTTILRAFSPLSVVDGRRLTS